MDPTECRCCSQDSYKVTNLALYSTAATLHVMYRGLVLSGAPPLWAGVPIVGRQAVHPMPGGAGGLRATSCRLEGSAAVMARIQSSRPALSLRSQQVAVIALDQYLSEGQCGSGVHMGNCSPYDVLGFMETEWVTKRGKTEHADGKTRCSYSYAKSTLSLLNDHFSSMGRVGEWEPSRPWRNPCESWAVRQWRKGYEKQEWHAGVEPIGAFPISAEKLCSLLDALRAESRGPPGSFRYRVSHLLLMRDMALFAYLYESHQRGGEGARLRAQDLDPSPCRWDSLSPPAGVVAYPNGTKVCQRRNAGSIKLLPGVDARYCWMRLLLEFISACTEAEMPLPVGMPFFVASNPKRDGWGVTPLSTSGAMSRLKDELSRHGLYEGETMHSFRRGGIQGSQRDGVSDTSNMEKSLIRTKRVFETYASTVRKTRKVGAMGALPEGETPPHGQCSGGASAEETHLAVVLAPEYEVCHSGVLASSSLVLGDAGAGSEDALRLAKF
jgi:hypothetical protein